MPAVIVIGDRTSHGGTVIEGSAVTDTHGRKIARVGDKATCPRHGRSGIVEIASGDPTFIIDDRAVARHGDLTTCGATLISSQVVTTDDPSSSSDLSGANSAKKGKQAAAGILAAALIAPEIPQAYDLHFLVNDELTGKPWADAPYRITLPSGKELIGKTDANGLTQIVCADSPVSAKIEVPYYGNVSSGFNSSGGYDACGC